MEKERMLTALMYVVIIYFIASQFWALYFWYDWALDHNFLSAMFLGPIVGEFKGLLWPLFM
tara:strand:+ start:3917 stop:4099 length:183 start_codon:yes stop_codon:yes gene_type:complete